MGRPFRRRRWSPLPALLLLLFCRMLAAEPEARLEFLYIDANVGTSSGGHVALKIGESVYHYQNEDGYLRLAREDWERFRFVYNDLDNRNIHVARVRVDESAAARVRDRLSLLFLVQNRHVDFLDALDRDRALLRSLARGEPFEMPGVGFFERRPRESPALHELRAELARRFGAGFLAAEQNRLAERLAALAYPAEASPDPAPEPDRYPHYPALFSERTEDLYARRLALTVIAEEWPLRDGLLVAVPDRRGGPADLSEPERRWLAAYRERLVEAIGGGLRADPAGGGYPLLLALARFVAVSESLATNRLRVLDTLPPAHRAERFTPVEARRASLERLLNRLRAELPRFRRALLALEEPDETAYGQLESRASEIREIERGLADGRPIRFTRRKAPPEGWGAAWLPSPEPQALAWAEAAAAGRAAAFRDRLEALYRYELIGRNCVTELIRAVDSAFAAPDAAAALGGPLAPGERLSFVPYRFFELIQQQYRVESVALLPSYRNRMLRELARRGNAWAIHTAEASPWTSSLYEPQPGDTLFLLFTEDVFWPRPLFGAINLAYGLGAGAAGLFTAPFDGGRRLGEGLRGAVFSLPELVFGNIRKGSFDGVRSRTDREAGTGD